jgi:hypothetical protein
MKIFSDYFVMKREISSLLYIFWNSKGLTPSFFLKLETVDVLKNSHTIYNKLLFRLYASTICVTSQFVITPFAPFSAPTLMRAYASSRSSPRHTDQHHTFFNRRGCSWFSYLAFVSFWMVSVVNVSTQLDPRWTWSLLWNATDHDIHLVWLYNQISHKDFVEFFVCHSCTTWIVQ